MTLAPNTRTGNQVNNVLTVEQDVILDLYIQKLDAFFENLKESEKIQVEIETLHLKRIVTK
ncbi:hypothetical protein [Adhaeribacter pallidiroseus]|uniref:Uncharacterized protein n=1 Tax=Adhaeribacter pallidiroseus TaxID=2072847 RepID=A0A369QMK7_9BACT|nr:hypothetical protein [Adhaeribacter pallidiroseus]RDC64446.1 hypothetical protein AHMF7616_03060 [Adhaeribacter pallidiroseus]